MMLRRTPWREPYTDDGRTTFPVRNRPGVYLIRRASFFGGEPVLYIGHSRTDVYKTMYRHFQTWNDSTRSQARRMVYSGSAHEVRIIWTRTAQQAAELEAALILRLEPRDNPNKLQDYTLTAAGARMARDAASAPTIRPDDEPPF